MNEHLFKLKKDGKTVGYAFFKGALIQYDFFEKTIDIGNGQKVSPDLWCQSCTIHPFVTKDKNGKDVFAGDRVKAGNWYFTVIWQKYGFGLKGEKSGWWRQFHEFENIELIEDRKMNDLLKVLDMSEEEQDRWCALNTDRKSHEHLADLAFRLRDEAEKEIGLWWAGAISKVFFYIAKTPERFFLSTEDRLRQFNWFATKAKTIHWIITALIAKGKK